MDTGTFLKSPSSSAPHFHDRVGCNRGSATNQAGFTLVELLVVLAVIACVATLLVPSLAKSQPVSKGVLCMVNQKRLVTAWQMYAADYSDRVINNFGIPETAQEISAGTLNNWANNVMSWSASISLMDRSNTNRDWVTGGVLGKYVDAPVEAYRCPADTYLSPQQVSVGWQARIRSVSMNCLLGRFAKGNDQTAQETNPFMSEYMQYTKRWQVPKPSKTWLFVDEHPDSINDGYYINQPTSPLWQDIPAAYHEGGCGFSFVDGHAEIRKWLSGTSQYPVRFQYGPNRNLDAAGKKDFAWYLERSAFKNRQTGELKFGY